MNIIFYHQDGCPQCKMVKMLLDKKKISYNSCKDIEEMKNKGLYSTPALEVDGKMLIGKPMMDWIKER